MVTIEINGTRVEAESLAEAQRKAKKVERQQQQAESAKAHQRELAYQIAAHNFYRAMQSVEVIRRGGQRGWVVGVPDSENEYERKTFTRNAKWQSDTLNGHWLIRVERASITIHDHQVLAVIEDSSGYLLGVQTKCDHTHEIHWSCVGSVEEQGVILGVPQQCEPMMDELIDYCHEKHA